MPNARNDATHDRVMTRLNLYGLSHGKCSKASCSMLGVGEKGDAKGDAKTKKKRNAGYAILVPGKNRRLARATKSCSIPELKKTLPGYQGGVIFDSCPGWLNIRKDHQMRAVYQIRLIKNDLKYRKSLGGEARALLEALKTFKKTAAGGKLADRKYRIAAADGMDAEIAELFERDYTGKSKTVSGYAKRHRTEDGSHTTHLRGEPSEGAEPDYVPGGNSPVEMVGRKMVAIKSDGGGNRSQKGNVCEFHTVHGNADRPDQRQELFRAHGPPMRRGTGSYICTIPNAKTARREAPYAVRLV